MNEIPRYYLRLFNAVTDAISEIDAMNYGSARNFLIEGQRWAEALYIAEMEGEVTNEKELEIFLKLGKEQREEERKIAQEATDALTDQKIHEYWKRTKQGIVEEDTASDGKPEESQT